MGHNADKRSVIAPKVFKQHYDALIREETCFHISELVYENCSLLSTSAADKMAVEAYSRLLSCALGSYPMTSTALHTNNIYQGVIQSIIPVNRVPLATPCATARLHSRRLVQLAIIRHFRDRP